MQRIPKGKWVNVPFSTHEEGIILDFKTLELQENKATKRNKRSIQINFGSLGVPSRQF